MSRSKPHNSALPPGVDDDDEIEILEIVGVDDDAEPGPERRSDEIGGGGEGSPPGLGDLGGGDRLMRLQADFENYQKRVERENEATRRQASARVVKAMLPVLDNFERAVAAAPATAEEGSFHDGFVLIFRQLLEALRAEGLSAIDSLGQPFDPNLHEAVATDTSCGLPANTIVEELQRGYLLHHRLLRPALVKVSLGSQGNEPPESDEGS